MSAQVTDAHVALVDFFDSGATISEAAQAIADSEAKAVQTAQDIKSEWAYATMVERNELRAERDKLRGYYHEIVAELGDDLALKCIRDLRAEVERLRNKASAWETDALRHAANADNQRARAERAEAELAACKESLHLANGTANLALVHRDAAESELAGIRALADRRNKRDHSKDTTHQLVAALDQALDIAQAELATERARLDWLELRGPWDSWNGFGETGITLRENIRAAIDAAIKEGA